MVIYDHSHSMSEIQTTEDTDMTPDEFKKMMEEYFKKNGMEVTEERDPVTGGIIVRPASK